MSDAEIGYGILVKVEATPGSGTFTAIGYQKDIKGGGWSVDAVDTGHTQSPNKVKGKIPGMVENKPVSFEIQYKPGSAAVTLINSLRALVRKFRTVMPDGDYYEYDAFINDFDPDSPTEDKQVAAIEITLTEDVMTYHAAAVPANSTKPAISGVLQVGQVLTAYEGVWANEPTSYTYQWKNAGTNIAGATNRTYTVQADDAGDAITVAVTGVNSAGNATATSAPAVIENA